jgi:hypothetical protein
MRTLTVTMLAAGLLCLAPDAGAARNHHLTVSGQAGDLRPAAGSVENVRWTVTNTGDGRLDHVRLIATVPATWTVKDGPGCTRAGTNANLRCELGPLDAGRHITVDVPMIVHRPLGPVELRAWAAGAVGHQTVPGPETSFQVVVIPRR